MSFVTPPWNENVPDWQFDTFTTGYFVVSALTQEGTMKLTFDKTSTGPDSGLNALDPTVTYLEYEIYFNKEGGQNVLIPGSSVPIPSSIIRSPGWNFVKVTNRVVVNGQDIGAGNPQKIDCWLISNTTVPDYVYFDYVAIQRAGEASGDGSVNLSNVTGVLPVAHGGTAVTISTGRSAAVLNVEPVLKNVTLEGDLRSVSNALSIHGNVYTDFLHGNAFGTYGIPLANTTGVLPRWREADPHRTGTGNVLVANVDPIISNSLTVVGDIISSNIIGNVSLTNANGLLPVSAGGTGTTFKTGTGAVVLNTNAVFKGTTTMANVVANFSGNGVGLHTLNVSNATVGVLAVERGGTGVSTKTGFGNVVLSGDPLFTSNITVLQNVFANVLSGNLLSTANLVSQNVATQTATISQLLTAPNIASDTGYFASNVRTAQLFGNLLGQTATIDQLLTAPNISSNTLTVGTRADFLGNVSVFGNLVVASGNVVYIDSEIQTSEQIIVDNAGDGAALIVKQSGAQPIMEAHDDGNVVFKIFDTGTAAFASGLDNRLNDTSTAPTGALVSVLGNVSVSQSIDTPHVYGNISGQTAVMDFLVGDGWQLSNIVPANVVGLVQTLEAANANILTLSSNVNVLSANVDDLSGNVDSFSSYVRSNIDTLSSNVNVLSANVDVLSANVNVLSSNVNVLSANVDDLSSNVNVLSANVDDLSSNVNVLSANVNVLSSNVNVLSANVDVLSANVDVLSANVDDLSSNVNVLSANVDDLSSNVNVLSGNVDAFSSYVRSNIDTLSSNVNVLSANVDDLSSNVNFLSANVNVLSSNVNVLSSNVDVLSGNVDDLSSNVNVLSANVDDLSSNVDVLSANVDDLSSNVNVLSGNVDAFSSYVRSNIDTLSSNVNVLSANVDDLSSNVNVLSANVNVLSANVNALSSNVNVLSSNVNVLSANVDDLSSNVDTLSNTVQSYTDTFTTSNLTVTQTADLSTLLADTLTVRGNTRLQGNLIIDSGNVVYVDSQVEISEQLVVHNQGTGPAVDVLQTGAESLARFVDDGNVVMQMYNWGNVAFASGHSDILNNTTQSPSDALVTVFGSFAADTIRGNISSSNVIGLDTSISDLWANAGAQQTEIIGLQSDTVNLWSNADAQQTAISDLWANAGNQQTELTSLWSNAEAQQTSISDLWANAGDQQTELTSLWSNAEAQQTSISDLWANAGAQQTEIIGLQSDTVNLWSNAASQQTAIDELQANAGAQQTDLIDLWSNAASQQTAIGDLWSNAASQQTAIGDLQANTGSQQTEITGLLSDTANLWSNAQAQQLEIAQVTNDLSNVFVSLDTGTVTANVFIGDGSQLLNVGSSNASLLTEGTLSQERLPTTIGNVSTTFIGDGSQLLNVGSSNASLLTEGTLSQDRLPTTIGNAQTSFVGDGSQLTNVGSSNASFLTEGTLSQDRLPTTIGNVNTTFLGNGALLTDVDATIPDNLDVSTVTANVFYGDGGFLSNIDIDVANIDLIMTSGYIQEDFDVLGNLTGNLVLANTDGTTAAPSYAFRSETDAGMYLAQANTLGFSVSGTEIFSANLDGLQVSGNISASYLFGNGALLEGVASSNASSLTEGVISQIVLPQTLGNTVTDFVGQSVDVSGNISGTYILGNGALLEGVASSNASSLTEGVVAESVLPAYLQSSNLANSVLNNAEIELNLLVANLSAGNGSQTQPSYTFDESPSTGLYLYDANVIGFTTAGSEIAQVSTEGLVVSGNISGAYILGNGALLEGVASSNASSLTEGVISQNVLPQTLGNTLTSFVGNGYYLESLNAAALSGNIDADVVLDGNVDGEIILEGEMDASVLIVGGNLSIGVPILLEDGNASEPMLSFTNATSTGVYLESGNMGISANGTGVLTVTPTALVPQSNETYDLGSSTNAFGSLYLSGNTLYLGNVVLKDEDGSLSTSAQLVGDGSGLSNLTAANINGLSDALDVIQATSVTANIFSGNGAGLDGILASNITGLTQALDVIQASSVDANVANVGIISVETVVSNILIDGEVTTTGNVFAGGNITAFASDKRLKSNIQPIQNAVELIKKLHGYTFTWRDDIPGLPMRGDDIGLLAQELQDLGLDQCVSPAPFDLDQLGHSRSGEQYLTIHYNKLFAVVIQALHDIIDAMAL